MKKIVRFLDSIYPFAFLVAGLLITSFFIEFDLKFIAMVCLGNIIIFSPLMIPSLVLFYTYLKHDDGGHLSGNGVEMIYRSGNEEYVVTKIVFVHRYFENELYFSFLPWDSYHYIYLETENRKSFYLTCFSYKKQDIFNVNGRVDFEIKNVKFPKIGCHDDKFKDSNKKTDSNLDKKLW